MGSIVNGIGLTQGMLKPYGSTFLIFSDYMRPAVGCRRSRHMQSLWVWTHDRRRRRGRADASAGRAPHGAPGDPEPLVRPPGDANETAMAWRIALEREGGPVALSLSRQKLPTLDRTEVAPAEDALRGAYTLWQSGDGLPTSSCSRPAPRSASPTRRRRRWTRTSASSRCRAGSSSPSSRRTTATR